MKQLRNNIILRTAIYYVVLFGVARWLWTLPQAQSVIHASLEALVSGNAGAFSGLGPGSSIKNAVPVQIDATTLALMVAAAMIGSVLLSIPVAWIYTLTRAKKDYQQSVVQTLILLPALVGGVVVLVKYSLALAFSLAGIVAAVRFRTTLEDSKDAVYIFLATAIGLAAAVQLPMAAVISVVFNALVLFLWYTDFGKAATYEGNKASKQLEDTRARMRQTGSFVAMLDDDIFANMTPDQLELAADRAWRRKRRLNKDELPDEEMQRREVLLRLRSPNPDRSRIAVEALFDEYLKKWRLGGVVHEPDGTHVIEYAIQLKKSARSEDLLNAIHEHAHDVEAEIT